jgi:hypothetical protein
VGQIFTEDSHIGILEAQGGWQNVNKDHIAYMNMVFGAFSTAYIESEKRDERISSFDDFIKVFKSFVTRITPTYPITKSGFICSPFCTPNISGLIVEIAQAAPGDDKEKYTKFINDPNFPFYTRAAEKFGFKIDKNAPWCLVADLGSPVMENYMRHFPLVPDVEPPLGPKGFLPGDIVTVPNLYDDPTLNLDLLRQTSEFGELQRREIDQRRRRTKASKKKVSKRTSKTSPRRFSTQGISKRNILFRVVKVAGLNVMISPVPGFDQLVNILVDVGGSKFLQKTLAEGIRPIMLNMAVPTAAHEERREHRALYIEAVENYLNISKLTFNNIFDRRYFKAYLSDFDALKVYALEFYNSHIRAKPFITRNNLSSCVEGKIIEKTVKRSQISFGQMMEKYDDEFWLLLYAEIRIQETNIKLNKSEKKVFFSTLKNYVDRYSNLEVLNYINRSLSVVIKPSITLTPKQKFDIEFFENLSDPD